MGLLHSSGCRFPSSVGISSATVGWMWTARLMTVYGAYVCYLMLRRPDDLAVDENHVSWAHMYRMMFVAQIGFALAYLDWT